MGRILDCQKKRWHCDRSISGSLDCHRKRLHWHGGVEVEIVKEKDDTVMGLSVEV